jgi:hypothetical protein
MSTSLKDLVPLLADDPPDEDRLVEAPEFEVTQVAKKLAGTIPVFAAALVGGLELLGVEEATDPPYVIAALGVTAAGFLALGTVAAADIVGRAYVEAAKRRVDATNSIPGQDSAAAVAEQASERLDAAAQEERDALSRESEAERKRLDLLAEEERQRLDLLAEEERERLDRVANDERKRQDRVAEEERNRLGRAADDERQWRDRAAEAARSRGNR